MEKTMLTIAIPIYNTETTLKKCLDSAVNQTLHDIEIICVDDCSEDNSAKILVEYARSVSHRLSLTPAIVRHILPSFSRQNLPSATG